MCKPASEGGQRCAAHSRPRYQRTPRTSPDWPNVARDYASTPEGHDRLTAEAEEARALGEYDREADLRAALLRGESLRAANAEAARILARGRQRTISQAEIDQVREAFGVTTEQVLRDHAVSHVLGALSSMPGAGDLVFFGGTALSRTFLPALRLSEDVDLLARGDRTDLAHRIERAVARRLRRSHGTVAWTPSLAATSGSEAAVLRVDDRIHVRVQLLGGGGHPRWPTEQQRLIQRYADAPEATLTTLTAPAFVASKTMAWLDRQAPRDLYDLWALGEHGHIGPEAADLFSRHGPTGGHVQPWMFSTPPAEGAWQDALGHQGAVRVSAADALAQVRARWARVG